MTDSQLRSKLQALTTSSDCLDLLSELFGTKEDCNGTLAECFVAGCVNAMDMRDDGEIKFDDDQKFLEFALSEVNNMYPLKK